MSDEQQNILEKAAEMIEIEHDQTPEPTPEETDQSGSEETNQSESISEETDQSDPEGTDQSEAEAEEPETESDLAKARAKLDKRAMGLEKKSKRIERRESELKAREAQLEPVFAHLRALQHGSEDEVIRSLSYLTGKDPQKLVSAMNERILGMTEADDRVARLEEQLHQLARDREDSTRRQQAVQYLYELPTSRFPAMANAVRTYGPTKVLSAVEEYVAEKGLRGSPPDQVMLQMESELSAMSGGRNQTDESDSGPGAPQTRTPTARRKPTITQASQDRPGKSYRDMTEQERAQAAMRFIDVQG